MKRLVFFLMVVMAACSMSGCNTLGFGKTNKQPLPPLPEIKDPIQIQKVWQARPGVGSHGQYLRLTPQLDGSTIYTTDVKGHISAVADLDGRILWTTKVKDSITAGPGAGDGRVYITTGNAKAYAFDAKTGKQLWQAKISNQSLANPVYTNGLVIFKTIDADVIALNARTGKQVWHYEGDTPRLILRASSVPVETHGGVVVGFANGEVVVLTVQEGKLFWQKQVADPQGFSDLSRMVDIDADPVPAGNTLFVATYQGNISALDLRTGKLIWQHKLSSYTGMAVSDDKVFVTDADGRIWAFNASTGQVAWRQNKLARRQLTGPALLGHYLVVADRTGYEHWLDQADGDIKARQFLGKAGVITNPFTHGNRVYLQMEDGNLLAQRVG
ncbi:MAG: outer membrane protein assembly factor BamB [Legionellales bacterium]|nr:outer membrane protein assembly factor BamB [Legionellales bacterium]|tara:strand:- start:8222 stop:9376 length:1155 start_codon:yes stop_codon:yes gene_type:complete